MNTKDVIWLQAKQDEVFNPNFPERLENYHRLYSVIADIADKNPGARIEYEFCPVTDTINFAASRNLFTPILDLARSACFLEKPIIITAMDDQERAEFREMIISGGSYRGY